MILKSCFTQDLTEAGCDEAGRGCLAGPVFAAAVILPRDFEIANLNDSKKLSAHARYELRECILEQAVDTAVAWVSPARIDEINILNASFEAMHIALDKLKARPDLVLVDGNRFTPWRSVSFRCITGGDGILASIASASVLAKTCRDDFMAELHAEYPQYGWDRNKGYPTPEHVEAIVKYGLSPHHRKTFHFKGQFRLPF